MESSFIWPDHEVGVVAAAEFGGGGALLPIGSHT